ncbi:uncharacterized protein BYT42DRAFT_61189 [Radiomyces spectabilis]|uniref:uncharacterized protein n=1 Tax=Radiomyces spectabilis TaxID=64574 RepID=UPI00222118FF|nr:uncharacterized protein BYT42DRAFT_61189 [Radiomyces spectabilis]KAI8373194.1 hypothetical protein BYT42DRAFT_61189 [Radiomyces spectabilis]
MEEYHQRTAQQGNYFCHCYSSKREFTMESTQQVTRYVYMHKYKSSDKSLIAKFNKVDYSVLRHAVTTPTSSSPSQDIENVYMHKDNFQNDKSLIARSNLIIVVKETTHFRGQVHHRNPTRPLSRAMTPSMACQTIPRLRMKHNRYRFAHMLITAIVNKVHRANNHRVR